MENFVMKLIEMSISASWLVLVVLVLRILLKKSPKWIHVCLWALVAVRMICPVSVEMPISMTPTDLTEQVMEALPNSYYGDSMIHSYGTENYDLAVSAGIQPEEGDNGYRYVLTQPDDPTKPVHTMQMLWDDIWLIGLAVMLIYALESYTRLKRKVSASIHLNNGVYLCDYIDTPFILGIVRPKIYLPSAMEPDSASHVLAHERAHIARRDHWWKPLGYLLLTVHWFNPLMWLAYILVCRDIELACDEKVVKQMALPERKSYSDALLQCSVRRMHVAACPLAFGEVGVKERVKTVLNYKKPAFWIVLVAVIALIVTAICFLTDPKTEEPDGTKPAADSTEASGGTPYEWTSSVAVWDIRKAWIHSYGDDSYPNTLEGSRLDELLAILNNVTEEEIVFRKPAGEDDPLWNLENYTSVSFTYADGVDNLWVWLRYADDTVIIGTDSMSDVWKTEEYGYWAVENESLILWMEKISNGGTWMLSDENRDEIRRLVRQEHVQFFSPQEYEDMLFVGCAYDNGRGLGVACFEKVAYGYKLRKLIRDEEVKQCASGGDLYYCDFNSLRIFLVMNDSVTGMEWAGAYEAVHTIDTHPGLVVEYFPQNLGSMYRFIYSGGSTTMYMDWDNQTYGQVPNDAAETFANPDDAYSVCSQLRLEQIEFASVTELVEVDERLNQACSYYPNSDELRELLNLLQAIPEDAYEQAEYPEKDFRILDIQFRNYSGVAQASPCLTLRLHEGAVYYRFKYEWMKPYQTWKINSPELVQYLESFFGGDMSEWERFAPVPKIDGVISGSFDEVEITTMRMSSFEYLISEDGLRFKPRDEEHWVLLQYAQVSYAADKTGLKTFSSPFGLFAAETCVTGYYNESEYWSFQDVTFTEGDTVSHIYLINEAHTAWVKEYADEISWILLNLDIQLTG